VVREEVEAAIARFLLDLAQDRAVGLNPDPRCEAESVRALERDQRAQVNVRFTVKLERLSNPAIDKFRFVVSNEFRTVGRFTLNWRRFWLGPDLQIDFLTRWRIRRGTNRIVESEQG